ncbi:MAG: hypothetical protein KIT25_06210 [Enhydrobacter sp.]|nr:MAG: hypothetical protein KIT25_06210 [Enhydrobacter sp.]
MGTFSLRSAINPHRLLVAAALCCGFTLAMTAVALSYSPGPAQEKAERECAKHGLGPQSPAWELCLAHVTRAFEWEERALAQQLARASGDAAANCLDLGLPPQGAPFRACLSREIEAQSQLQVLGDSTVGDNVAEHPSERLSLQQ